jgi:hypothetical protein
MNPVGNDSLGSDGMAMGKTKILRNKREEFLDSLSDAIGDLRRMIPARLIEAPC